MIGYIGLTEIKSAHMTAKKPSSKQQAPRKAARASQRDRLRRRVALQKKALRALVGIGASGFTDISREHDTYPHKKA
ncbi:MAG: hypothetical protein AB1411_07705 [Nitrospirota bacterium]